MPITLAPCTAHVRRKFNDVLKGDRRNPHAAQAMKMIQDLYKIEDEASELSAEERFALRQEKARPLFDQFKKWLYQAAGREYFLFHAEPRGAKDSATLYTIIETAKANSTEPMHYLLFLFRCYRHFGSEEMPWEE
ncbi:MAG: transposase [Spirochaetales bacterium]|nr:transposase [Spirochaetales bacterium]